MTTLLLGAGIGILLAPGALLLVGFLFMRSFLR